MTNFLFLPSGTYKLYTSVTYYLLTKQFLIPYGFYAGSTAFLWHFSRKHCVDTIWCTGVVLNTYELTKGLVQW
jgi:hypothetical protein